MTLKIENNIRLEDIEVFQANPGSLANLQDTDQQLGAAQRERGCSKQARRRELSLTPSRSAISNCTNAEDNGLDAVDAGELLSTLYLHTRVQNIVATVGKHPFATSASKKALMYRTVLICLFDVEMIFHNSQDIGFECPAGQVRQSAVADPDFGAVSEQFAIRNLCTVHPISYNVSTEY
ncbi:hypothetical protein PCH_Pc22g17400 [Penicillium rubens Wisconsin 54-1255]|uniref:Uncharacterized protein n=1 Tax=Penicillium rubens (strain ATCC 28089 / DSM 1075 / NRRL 1951 / Wisconsin 54-1255) TaxID=500485 RepID=B6HSU5_PENRW|nr:hypothetical protein PCH_Pc22g17400 [Penicillium rubens Wisconsin 54-1255]